MASSTNFTPAKFVLGIIAAKSATNNQPIILGILSTYRVRAMMSDAITDTELTTVEITDNL